MSRRFHGWAAGLGGLILLSALPAMAADVTVIGHYTFANGDTLTRPSYYTSSRLRTTLPNGDEIIYNHGNERIALVNHAGKRYWEGPRAEADTIASRIRAERHKAIADTVDASREMWTRIYSALGDSVRFDETGKERKVAGYTCKEWRLTAGSYLRQTRWVARDLDVPDFSREIGRVVLATMLDPVARGLMTVILQSRYIDGLTLASETKFKTLDEEGTISWEALEVRTGKIPKEVWEVPKDYQRWEPPAAGAVK
jgi:hypothetical protein